MDATIDFLPASVREACVAGKQKPFNPHAQRLLVACNKATGRLELPKPKGKCKAKAKAKAKCKAKAKAAAIKNEGQGTIPKKSREETAYGAAKKKYLQSLLLCRFSEHKTVLSRRGGV